MTFTRFHPLSSNFVHCHQCVSKSEQNQIRNLFSKKITQNGHFDILHNTMLRLTSSVWIYFISKALSNVCSPRPQEVLFSTCPQLKILSTPTIVTQSVVEISACTSPCSNIKTNTGTHFMVGPHMYISNFSKLVINWLEMIRTSWVRLFWQFQQKKLLLKIFNPLSPSHIILFSSKVYLATHGSQIYNQKWFFLELYNSARKLVRVEGPKRLRGGSRVYFPKVYFCKVYPVYASYPCQSN